jgi:hypothetical protein
MSESNGSNHFGTGVGEPAGPSQRKITANQQNSLKSTGPRTAMGKARSSQNAATHGLTAVLPITSGEGKEDLEAFERMRQGLYESWNPLGYQEEKLVEMLAGDYWRLDRAARYESGATRLNSDHSTRDDQLHRQRRHSMQVMELGTVCLPSPELRETSFGIDFLIDKLECVKDSVEAGAAVSEKQRAVIAAAFWQPGRGFWTECDDFIDDLHHYEKEGKPDEAKQCRNACLASIGREIELLKERRRSVVAHEELALEAKRLLHSLPDAVTLDRLCRYTTTISRRIAHTMNQLERLQRIRKAKFVPAPMTLQVATEGPLPHDSEVDGTVVSASELQPAPESRVIARNQDES